MVGFRSEAMLEVVESEDGFREGDAMVLYTNRCNRGAEVG